MARPDVPVFPPAGEVHLDLRLPSQDVADSPRDAVSLSDADLGAVRRACFGTVGAIPEDRQDHLARPVWAAGKLAAREPRLADAVPDHHGSASAVYLGHPAWIGLVGRWEQPRVAVAPDIPGAGLSAA